MYLKLIFCLVISIAFSPMAWAQPAADSIEIENIIVTATRVAKGDPLTHQNVTLEEIESINLGQDPVKLIEELSPSIVSYTDGGTDIGNYTQFRLRGIDQSRINITLNGVPLNDMIDHGVYFSNFSDFGNSVQSMQIQRGVSASNMGVASYGGAISFESINLFGDDASGEAQVTVGSFGTLRTAAEATTGLMDSNVGLYTRLTRTQTDGYKFNSASDSYSLFFSGGKITDKDVIKLTAFTGKTQNGQSYEHVPLATILQEPRTNFNDLNDVDDFEQHMVQLQYARSLSQDFTFYTTGYYNGAGGVFPYSYGGDQYMYGLTNDHFGLMAHLAHEEAGRTLSAGIHAYTFDRTNFEFITPFVTAPYTRDFTDKKEASVFLKYKQQLQAAQIYVNVELRTIGMAMNGDQSLGNGLNMDHSWTFFNTVLGASINLNPASSVYLSYGCSSREPTRTDILNGVTKAETVNDVELGLRHEKGQFSLQTNLFYMAFQDEISKIGALQERSYMEIRQNVASSRRLGIELQSSYQASQHWSLSLNAAFMKTNIEQYENTGAVFRDVEQIFAPDWVIQPNIKYHFGNGNHFRLGGRYVSSSFTELSNNSDFLLPAHFILNAQLALQLTDRTKLNFMLSNITDQLYYTEGSPIDIDFDGSVDDIGYRVQPPRHFYIMVSYRI